MKVKVIVRPSSRAARTFFCCTALLAANSLVAADYPDKPSHQHLKTFPTTLHPALTARAALFEKNDVPRAAKLAQVETSHALRDVDGWFLSMEAAALQQDRHIELASALNVCTLAKADDPRSAVAAMRLAELGDNSESFRQNRTTVERLAVDSPCSAGAVEALYKAALDGLSNADVRDLARRSGWLLGWTISRTGAAAAKSVSEHFEFADGRIHLPDYLPRSARYVGETEFVAPSAGDYTIAGDLTGVTLRIDENEIADRKAILTAGPHHVQIAFRASEASPQLRITPARSLNEAAWTTFRFTRHEAIYLRAAVALAAGEFAQAAAQIQSSELKSTSIGQQLLADATQVSTADRATNSCEALHLQSCADSLAYAQWLIAARRHSEAIEELSRVVRSWPLDRDAHRMLIAELQLAGNNSAADRAAADFLRIAPNARTLRRMAENAPGTADSIPLAPFYETYRRPAPTNLPISAEASSPAIILLQDKVAIARLDGSVSVYMHRVVQLMTADGAREYQPLVIPNGGQSLTARLVHTDQPLPAVFHAGDEVEEEYVVNYTGDGGMISHPEAFQYVFNDFDWPLLNARFVVLSPSSQSPGYVIASGDVPASRIDYVSGLCAQIWEKTQTSAESAISAPSIVRVVENENGWSIPPSVERRRILETIHPGPRNREA